MLSPCGYSMLQLYPYIKSLWHTQRTILTNFLGQYWSPALQCFCSGLERDHELGTYSDNTADILLTIYQIYPDISWIISDDIYIYDVFYTSIDIAQPQLSSPVHSPVPPSPWTGRVRHDLGGLGRVRQRGGGSAAGGRQGSEGAEEGPGTSGGTAWVAMGSTWIWWLMGAIGWWPSSHFLKSMFLIGAINHQHMAGCLLLILTVVHHHGFHPQ